MSTLSSALAVAECRVDLVLKPGMWLDPAVVDKLCQFDNWTVKMADNEIIEALFSAGAGAISGATRL